MSLSPVSIQTQALAFEWKPGFSVAYSGVYGGERRPRNVASVSQNGHLINVDSQLNARVDEHRNEQIPMNARSVAQQTSIQTTH